MDKYELRTNVQKAIQAVSIKNWNRVDGLLRWALTEVGRLKGQTDDEHARKTLLTIEGVLKNARAKALAEDAYAARNYLDFALEKILTDLPA